MSYIFVSKPIVAFDIADVVTYYKSINPELAKAFLDRIDDAKKYIADFPLAFQIKHKNVRTVLLEQFPYHILYLIDDSKNKS